jgi:hypothetical protein
MDAADYKTWWAANTDVPYGTCWCGCGARTNVAPQSSSKQGWVKGEPLRFLPRHHARVQERKPRKLHPDNAVDICHRNESGERGSSIAKDFGVTKETI